LDSKIIKGEGTLRSLTKLLRNWNLVGYKWVYKINW
jgi:hypothetical protein